MKKKKQSKKNTTKKVSKKKTKRSQAKYPGLEPRFNAKIRHESLDYDYLDQLSEEEKEWLNRFSEEYIGANFRHRGEIIQNTPEQKKDCYDRNNARNRCIYSIAKATRRVKDVDDTEDFIDCKKISKDNDTMDAIIDYIYLKQKKKK